MIGLQDFIFILFIIVFIVIYFALFIVPPFGKQLVFNRILPDCFALSFNYVTFA